MVGRDVDSSPVEYRTWVVDGYPDYDGYYYTGPKGGTNPLVDVVAYPVINANGPIDFNLPDPTFWQKTYTQLPSDLRDAHLAIVDGYVYLFGGKHSNKIFRTSTCRPTDWKDTGATLPTPLYGAQIAIISGRIYLFGGNNGVATDTIYSAPLIDPLTWTNHGSYLPQPLYHSQLLITGTDGYIYLFGGSTINHLTDNVFYASVYDPFTWHVHSKRLPKALCGSSVAYIANVVYLLGGISANLLGTLPSADVYYIELTELINESSWWNVLSNELPYAMAFAQFVTVGYSGYLIGIDHERVGYYMTEDDLPLIDYVESGSETYNTKIFKCSLSPDSHYHLNWRKIDQEIKGEIFQSQLAIIYDRLFLFGGNGSSIIFACRPITKYNFGSPDVYAYGDVTRTQYSAATNSLELFRILCFPYWKTDYFNDSHI